MRNGQSYKTVIDTLTAQGYFARNGRKFSNSTLNAMLRNDKYYGTYVYNRKNGKRKENRVLIEKFDEVRNSKAIPAIIDKSLFDRVQGILDGRTVCRPQLNQHPEYILTGFLYCKSCGSTMSGESNIGGRNKTRTRTYVCRKSRRDKVCKTKAINAVYLETAIKTVLTEEINNYLSSGNTANQVFNILKKTSTEERKSAKKRIDEFDNTIRVLLKKAANPSLSEDLSSTYESQAQECVDCRKTYVNRLAELDKIISKVDEVQQAFSEQCECLTMDEIFSSYEISRTIIGAFIEKIVVDDSNDDIAIIFKQNNKNKKKEKNYE